MKENPITSTIPFDQDGKFHGFLKLPYSHDKSAWGSIMMPITVIKNGEGKKVLCTGANHGDEYEGPIALKNLAYQTDFKDIQGTIIIVPSFNFPAFMAATRTSPIDKKNLNRIFPGNPGGSVTEKIADYFERTLVPMCDVVIDIHSGGKTLDFIPFAAVHILENKVLQKKCQELMEAFNAPYSTLLKEIERYGMFDTSVEDQGKVFLTTELGGGGTSTAKNNLITIRGIENVLISLGVKKGEVQKNKTTYLDITDDDAFIYSQHQGLLEPLVDLGDKVKKGDSLCKIWDMQKNGLKPAMYYANTDGVVCSKHFPSVINLGDPICIIAKPINQEDYL